MDKLHGKEQQKTEDIIVKLDELELNLSDIPIIDTWKARRYISMAITELKDKIT